MGGHGKSFGVRIELIDIHKHYGPVKANNGVSLVFSPGEIHGILGENGAGKSTLMKILAGYTIRTSGVIRANEKEVDIKSPVDSAALGVGMLYQDPLDFPVLSVKENFLLGQKDLSRKNRKQVLDQFIRIRDRLGFHLPQNTPVNRLTVGERQQLEIVRLISMGTSILILDEPTTGISDLQKQVLFAALSSLTDEGKTVILVSHKLEDVLALCHRVTVLREGRKTGEAGRPLDTNQLLEMMFGAPPSRLKRAMGRKRKPVFDMERVAGSGGRSGLKECSVSIRSGEVTALAGLEGSGQGVFMRLAAGLARPTSGRIQINGRDMTGKGHLAFKSEKTAFLPASRLEEGLMGDLSVAEHCCLDMEDCGIVLPQKKAESLAQDRISRFKIAGTPRFPGPVPFRRKSATSSAFISS